MQAGQLLIHSLLTLALLGFTCTSDPEMESVDRNGSVQPGALSFEATQPSSVDQLRDIYPHSNRTPQEVLESFWMSSEGLLTQVKNVEELKKARKRGKKQQVNSIDWSALQRALQEVEGLLMGVRHDAMISFFFYHAYYLRPEQIEPLLRELAKIEAMIPGLNKGLPFEFRIHRSSSPISALRLGRNDFSPSFLSGIPTLPERRLFYMVGLLLTKLMSVEELLNASSARHNSLPSLPRRVLNRKANVRDRLQVQLVGDASRCFRECYELAVAVSEILTEFQFNVATLLVFPLDTSSLVFLTGMCPFATGLRLQEARDAIVERYGLDSTEALSVPAVNDVRDTFQIIPSEALYQCFVNDDRIGAILRQQSFDVDCEDPKGALNAVYRHVGSIRNHPTPAELAVLAYQWKSALREHRFVYARLQFLSENLDAVMNQIRGWLEVLDLLVLSHRCLDPERAPHSGIFSPTWGLFHTIGRFLQKTLSQLDSNNYDSIQRYLNAYMDRAARVREMAAFNQWDGKTQLPLLAPIGGFAPPAVLTLVD